MWTAVILKSCSLKRNWFIWSICNIFVGKGNYDFYFTEQVTKKWESSINQDFETSTSVITFLGSYEFAKNMRMNTIIELNNIHKETYNLTKIISNKLYTNSFKERFYDFWQKYSFTIAFHTDIGLHSFSIIYLPIIANPNRNTVLNASFIVSSSV